MEWDGMVIIGQGSSKILTAPSVLIICNGGTPLTSFKIVRACWGQLLPELMSIYEQDARYSAHPPFSLISACKPPQLNTHTILARYTIHPDFLDQQYTRCRTYIPICVLHNLPSLIITLWPVEHCLPLFLELKQTMIWSLWNFELTAQRHIWYLSLH